MRTVPNYEEKWGLPTSPTTLRDEPLHSSTAPSRLQGRRCSGPNSVQDLFAS